MGEQAERLRQLGGETMLRANAMTIGQLSRRTGETIKVLRDYERLGFLYTLGRSESNYRLFGEETLWCVGMVQSLRALGLTLKEIQALTKSYLERPGESSDALLAEQLARVVIRVEGRIAALQALRHRVLDFQAACAGARTPPPELACLVASDPRRTSARSAS